MQFDTSLVGVGDKGVVECDSFKSNRIDIKIPDLVFEFQNESFGPNRVHGIRDFQNKLAYWTYSYNPSNVVFPNRRLIYNYENDSWAIFTDSLTALGTFQAQSNRTWSNNDDTWEQANYPWIDRPALFPSIVGGNQQGFVEYLDSQANNDVSLTINAIAGNDPSATVITSYNHNLETGNVIQIVDIPVGTPFASALNDKIFGVVVEPSQNDEFELWLYDANTQQFSDPQVDSSAVYVGGGQIKIRDNFSVISKKFNFVSEGQGIQLGFLDVLMDVTDNGAISVNVFVDYDDSEAVNTLPANQIPNSVPSLSDTFFNSIVPTTSIGGITSTKEWHRVYCAARSSFITLQWTLSNAQMVGQEQECDVQIDAQVLWIRRAGRNLAPGI